MTDFKAVSKAIFEEIFHEYSYCLRNSFCNGFTRHVMEDINGEGFAKNRREENRILGDVILVRSVRNDKLLDFIRCRLNKFAQTVKINDARD